MATGSLENREVQDFALRITPDPLGRAALAEAMAAGGYWQANFLRRAHNYLPPEQYGDLMARAIAQGAQVPCSAMGGAAAQLEQQGDGDRAAQFWPGDCPDS